MALDTTRLAGAEKQAEIARLKKELSVAEHRLQDLTRQNQSLRDDNDDLSQKLLMRAKRNGESTVLIDRLTDMRSQLRDSERQRETLLSQSADMKADLDQLHEELAGYRSNTRDDSEQVKALQQELEDLRKQSRQELGDIQEELDAAVRGNDRVSEASEQVLEFEALRQENNSLQQSMKDRLKELQTSQETGQLLEDELEDANREIDDLRRQLERQAAKVKELEDAARQPVSQVADLLEDNNDFIPGSVPVLKSDGAVGSGFDVKTAGISAIAGFLLASLLFMMTGGGDDQAAVESQSVVEQPATVKNTGSAAGQIIRKP
jgi:chromosome segregation ATPase